MNLAREMILRVAEVLGGSEHALRGDGFILRLLTTLPQT